MITGFASNTIRPSYGGTIEVNLPPGSSGCTSSMPFAVADLHVLLTESRCEVDDSGTGIGGDVVGREHPVRVRVPDEEVERRRRSASPTSVGALVLGRAPRAPRRARARSARRRSFGEHVALAVRAAHLDVVDVRMHRDREVGRQRPRRRGPDQRVGAVERCNLGARSGISTVTAGSWRILYASSSRVSWFDSGVCSYQLYGSTRKPW